MASWEVQLVAAILRNADPPRAYEEALKFGMRPDMFSSLEARHAWNRITAHYRRADVYGRVPSLQTFLEWFPSMTLPVPLEALDDISRKVIAEHLRRKMSRHLDEYIDAAREDVVVAMGTLADQLAALQEQAKVTSDIDFREVALLECAEDLVPSEDGALEGLPWPWEQLNETTQGIQPGTFTMIWGIPKSGKTMVGLVCMAHLFQLGFRVVVYSKEMRWKEIRRRTAAILSHTDYDRLKKKQLSVDEQEAYMAAVEMVTNLEHKGSFIFTQADRLDGGVGGPAEIRRKIDAYKPDIFLLDSSYMLEMPDANKNGGSLDWKNLSALTRALKQIAKTTGVPIVAISQENEKAALATKGKSRGTASMAFNTNAAGDLDFGMRVVSHKRLSQISLHFAVARESQSDGFTIDAVPCLNYAFVGNHLHQVGDDQELEAPAPGPRGGGGGGRKAAVAPAGRAADLIARASSALPSTHLRLVAPQANDEVARDTRAQEAENARDDDGDASR